MKSSRLPQSGTTGFTLMEMTIVICVLVILASTGFYMTSQISRWRQGREAAETLRMVYSAQRGYLADHPTAPLNTLTTELLLPYLPTGMTEIPEVNSLEGETLSIDVTLSPPRFSLGAGGTHYDPSDNPNDMLWDTGP